MIRMMKRTLVLLLLAACLPAAALCSDYLIGEGDVLNISVWGNKDLSLSVKVRPDGKITIPALGDVSAAGQSPAALQGHLTEQLKELVNKPVVTVIVQEINNSKIYFYGGGVKAGVYDLNRKSTLLQLLCQVGDLKIADLQKGYVMRGGKKIKEGFYKLFILGDVSEDMTLQADDIIFIPSYVEKNVYVVGAVNAPKIIEYREGMNVLDAILESGGGTKFAKLNDTVIYRRDGSKEQAIPVRVKDLIKDGDLSQNITLKPGDYVVVKEGMF